MVARFKLKLYVEKLNTRQALSTLYQILEFHSYTDYELTIIDVREDPENAHLDGIAKTPALVMERSGEKIATADFSNINKLRSDFGFNTSKKTN